MNENGRAMKKQHVKLIDTDREFLKNLIGQGKSTAKAYRRALALLELDRGQTYIEVSKIIQATIPTISSWAKKYQEIGLQCLADQPRTGRPIEIDGNQRAKVTALACSDPPVGYTEWSLRLLADKAVELGYCENLSHTTVRRILKKTN